MKVPSTAEPPRTTLAPLAGVYGMAGRSHAALRRRGDVLAGIAIPITLGTPTTGTLAAGNTVFYQVSPAVTGKLVAQVQAGGTAMRLSLLNGQNQVLMQSDGQSAADPAARIGVNVAPGPEYLEVEDLGDATAYTLTTSLTPSSLPFEPIPCPRRTLRPPSSPATSMATVYSTWSSPTAAPTTCRYCWATATAPS